MMTSFVIFIVSFAILTLTSCDSEIPLPTVGECTMLSNGAICTDKRLGEEDQEYELDVSEMKGYQCTSPSDYSLLRADISEKRKELAKLRRKHK